MTRMLVFPKHVTGSVSIEPASSGISVAGLAPFQTIPITEQQTVTSDIASILGDYRIAYLSRQAGIVGHREVMRGRAKFGIFGDGKELAQIAMARVFQPGDFRSGYYRDQTFMLATGLLTLEQFFAQLYAHDDVSAEPASVGRSMVAHFATRLIDENGHWYPQSDRPNTSADISPTAGQMPRLVGLAHASRLYREVDALRALTDFSYNGNEVAFGTIGNASTAEGHFWEALNAIGVLAAPAVISIWDDGYGISVPNEQQLTKTSLRKMLRGFRREHGEAHGFHVYTVPGWDYVRLLRVYTRAAAHARRHHIPAVIHVTEMTQPQGHSTSGSHARYKSAERLAWEAERDPVVRLRNWILDRNYATAYELEELERDATREVEAARDAAWAAMLAPLRTMAADLDELLEQAALYASERAELEQLRSELSALDIPLRRSLVEIAQKALLLTCNGDNPVRPLLRDWKHNERARARQSYMRHLYSETGGQRTSSSHRSCCLCRPGGGCTRIRRAQRQL